MSRATLLKAFAAAVASTGGVVAVAATVLLFGADVESKLFPVQTGFSVTALQIEGNDVIVYGQIAKRRACEYLAPTQGEDEAGGIYAVQSRSKTAGISWPPSSTPRPIGPWVLIGGKGHVITLTQRHSCHDLWDTYTRLGVIDARGLQ